MTNDQVINIEDQCCVTDSFFLSRPPPYKNFLCNSTEKELNNSLAKTGIILFFLYFSFFLSFFYTNFPLRQVFAFYLILSSSSFNFISSSFFSLSDSRSLSRSNLPIFLLFFSFRFRPTSSFTLQHGTKWREKRYIYVFRLFFLLTLIFYFFRVCMHSTD